ncbi:MAG: adenosylcobinamide-GDP ribazoletransferase [Thermoleophilaceae bacterium]|nr:adenosylcobinamide-GDP ribazoletransferase [Thermoleophilaceae bacterium]
MTVDELAPASGLRRAAAQLALAVSFLTVVPVRLRGRSAVDLGGAAVWFPVVGALIGALAGGVRAGAEPLFGATAATVLAMAALVLVTGALHQDGLADTADGLGVRGDPERRLAVMRDSATGAFGVLALVGWALLLLAALAPLSDSEALAALVTAGALSRWAALLHAAATSPARPEGLGAGFRVGRVALLIASACAVLVAGVAAGIGPGLAALGVTLAIALLSAWAARRAIGGRTGDTIGATVAVVEVAVCTALLGFWR